MPRSSSGTYSQPSGTSAISNATISSAAFNSLVADMGNEITNSLDRYGRTSMASILNLGGFRASNGATPIASSDLATKGYADTIIPSGSNVLFYQAAAPTGWTQVLGVSDACLRVVNGAGGVTHGSIGMAGWIAAGTQNHVLTLAEIPAHNHAVSDPGHTHTDNLSASAVNNGAGGNPSGLYSAGGQTGTGFTNISIQNNGGGGGHGHAFYDLYYADIIICSKN